MPVELVETKLNNALPVHLVAKDSLEATRLTPPSIAWAKANGFSGEAGRALILPGENGAIAGALFGIGEGEGSLAVGALARTLPEGEWSFASTPTDPELTALGVILGICLHPLRQEAGQGVALRIAFRCGCRPHPPYRGRRFPDA